MQQQTKQYIKKYEPQRISLPIRKRCFCWWSKSYTSRPLSCGCLRANSRSWSPQILRQGAQEIKDGRKLSRWGALPSSSSRGGREVL